MYPTFDISKLTDAQLHENLSKCYARRAHAERYGQLQLVQHVETMIAAIIDELQTREQILLQAREKKERKNKSDEINFGEINDDDDLQDFKY